MDFIKEKIRIMTDRLRDFKTLSNTPVEFSYIPCSEYKTTNTPPKKSKAWQITSSLRAEGVDTHYWLHLSVPKNPQKDGKEFRLSVKTGREGEWDATNPQFIVYVNGKTTQALDVNHTWLPLDSTIDNDIYLYLYTGMVGGYFDLNISLQTIDTKIEALYYDIYVPYLCMLELGENNYDYIKIRDCLDKALMLLDIRHVYSADFYNSVNKVSKYLKTEFYEKLCGQNSSIISCIGHTHIDVAWVWTVAQTREKAQRSFSTVLNLMRRYNDYMFMSSQPQLYDFVKENDPELYAEIKQRAKEGRWEAEGAMWLEADTNLSSGESLVRQILYGKRFLKEEFGIDSKILWLPDVFGYSAALPQILKKSGVTQFFTTKMMWNETNKMPNDSFIWEGIDGSQVFASFTDAYFSLLDPKQVHESWKNYKNKSLSDTQLLTFGFADGGGGPTYEMMEYYNRLKHGIPGMPKTVMKKAGQFFDETEESFEKNSAELKNKPKWIGEMYLEMHRGTYTSIAKNKKNNRKSELLYQEAESISVTDMALNGGEYPEELFRKNQFNILLNQFHDIIPGSSIKEVYDVTDAEYERILREGRDVVNNKHKNIKANLKTSGGVFVYNPTPFEISDYITIDGKTVYAEKVPAHGWKVVPNEEAKSSIKVSKKVLENDLIKVKFNNKYHIISIYDKQAGREVLANGAEGNRIEIFEDHPRDYDAWEITSYYKQKMWIADDVSNVEMLNNGIRVSRKYQNSTITQDIILNENSKRIDFVTTVDWHEDHVLMKAAFPVDVRCDYATYDIQFGNIKRPTHANTSWDAAKFEVCAHKWADLSEGDYGVSILNDCKYGYSIEDNVMKISLLKAATHPNPYADREVHNFTYSLYPHNGDYRIGGVVKEGYLLNMPLEASVIKANNGTLDDTFSLVSTDKSNVIAETIKKAETDEGIIVRLYETYNQKAEILVKTGFDFNKVYLCDLMENIIEELPHKNREVKVKANNYEIITLKFVR